WQKNITNNDGWLYTNSITQTYNQGYLILNTLHTSSGTHTADFWLIKTDEQGNTEWEKELGGSEGDYPCCVVSHNDGTHIIGGYTYSQDGDIENNNGICDI